MKTLKLLFICSIVICLGSAAVALGHKGPTLNLIKERGLLKVGVFEDDVTGFIEHSTVTGEAPTGLEPALARALAAAIGVDIEWVRCSVDNRLLYLDDGTVDVTIGLITWLLNSRDILSPLSDRGYKFGPIYYYDGTKIMINTALADPEDDPLNVAVGKGTSSILFLNNYEKPSNWVVKEAEDYEESKAWFLAGTSNGTDEIHALCSDETTLVGLILANAPTSDAWVVYGDSFGKTPFAAAVSEGDRNWSEVVRWVFYVLLEAEEQGFVKNGSLPEGWLDAEPTIPGLDPGWSVNAVNAEGNYGQIWENYIGTLVLYDRGNNRLWKNGGLMYSPPF